MNYFFDYDNFQYKINYNDTPSIGGIYTIDFRVINGEKNKAIGSAEIATEIPYHYEIHNNKEKVHIELLNGEMFLIGVQVKNVGKGLGKIFLNMIFDEFKISKLYFYSINHPYWEKIATKTGLYCNGGNVYTLTKEQITLK